MSAQRRNHRIEENPGGEGASGRVESKRLTQNSRQVVDGAPVGDGENSEGESSCILWVTQFCGKLMGGGSGAVLV